MANKSLLLISSRPEDQAFAAELAMTAGLSLNSVSDPRAGAAAIRDESPTVILCDTSSEAQYLALESAIQDTVGLFSEQINANLIFFLSSENIEKVQYLVQSPLFGNYIMRNYGDLKDAGAHCGRIVKAAIGERSFGLKALLKDSSKIQVIKLEMTNQKQEAVEAVKNYLMAAKFQVRMATVIANAVDELLMNAMFDAPTDELGRPIFSGTSRAASIKLEGKHGVEMQVGYDGQYVGIMAVDHFGSLDKNRLLGHISKIYTEEEYKVKSTVAGAGIGLARVFRSGGSFLFMSEARVRTEVTVFFKRTESFREFKDQFRFLSTQFHF
ncbi:hypothetical protein WDW37_04710 [Bdellovibrionota bacterium FG-1]